MAKAKADDKAAVIDIEAVATRTIEVCVLGTSPLLLNRLSEKARHELLMPSPPKNRAERAQRLKHDPYQEYRASVYRDASEDGPTRLVMPGGAFRKAIASAALDIPGSSKAQIGRLVRVVEYNVSVYGAPKLCCMIVRQAGMNRTPDVRTRAVLPEWACHISLRFASPLLTERAVLTLMGAAGDFIGVGDGRNEKGSSLSCGCFELVNADNPRFLKLKARAGRAAQDKALEDAPTYDAETEELLHWFDEELVRRDRAPREVPAKVVKKLAKNGRPELVEDEAR